MLNVYIDRMFCENLRFAFLVTLVSIIILQTLSSQRGWAANINCPNISSTCYGTPYDDIIFASSVQFNVVHGMGGNDFIRGYSNVPNIIYGDDGNDILLGGANDDTMFGGRGSDKYEGGFGDDTILEDTINAAYVGTLLNNDDMISGGEGDDYIQSGEGVDRIHSGPGNDFIYPNGYYRDFSFDTADCGSGAADKIFIYSGDPDIAPNCELITNLDR